jgi:hypothetical protein
MKIRVFLLNQTQARAVELEPVAASALEIDKSYYNSNTSLKYILSKKFLFLY